MNAEKSSKKHSYITPRQYLLSYGNLTLYLVSGRGAIQIYLLTYL